jgi:hypothetical protein
MMGRQRYLRKRSMQGDCAIMPGRVRAKPGPASAQQNQ